MAAQKLPPFHVSEQSASVLLGPIEASLAELEARLSLYVGRIAMSDADRTAIARAREIVAKARSDISQTSTTFSREAK